MSDDGKGLEQAREELVREDSDELLAAVDRLRHVEAEKREVPFSSPEFHQRAREVENQARRVFQLATKEEIHGEQLPETVADSGEDRPRWPGGTTEGSSGDGEVPTGDE